MKWMEWPFQFFRDPRYLIGRSITTSQKTAPSRQRQVFSPPHNVWSLQSKREFLIQRRLTFRLEFIEQLVGLFKVQQVQLSPVSRWLAWSRVRQGKDFKFLARREESIVDCAAQDARGTCSGIWAIIVVVRARRQTCDDYSGHVAYPSQLTFFLSTNVELNWRATFSKPMTPYMALQLFETCPLLGLSWSDAILSLNAYPNSCLADGLVQLPVGSY